MNGSSNSGVSPSSSPLPRGRGSVLEPVLAAVLLALLSAAALRFTFVKGYTLYYGDAEAHLNIARRLVDSRTGGYRQIGTVWLPLPHVLAAPLVRDAQLWHNGLAGAIPSAVCFVAASLFLYGAARRAFEDRWPAITAVCLFALNPNLLYLQSTPMNEAVFFAGFLGAAYFTHRNWPVAAGLSAAAASLTRYEGWFVIPFFAAWFLVSARGERIRSATVFAAIAGLGPLYWLAHNWWCYGDFFEFYRGPYSAKAIQGVARYPGQQHWGEATEYLSAATRLCLGWPAVLLGLAGLAVCVRRRVAWPLLLLLPAVFYVWSIHSAGTPIFVPHLWPNTYYNTRYGMALLPFTATVAAFVVTIAPRKWKPLTAFGVVVLAMSPWLPFREDRVITWKESLVNSTARREWTRQAADHFRENYRRGDGIFTTFGDLTGIYRQAGLPLGQTLCWDDPLHWHAAAARPDLFLWEQWAVAIGGDPVQKAVLRARRRGPYYALEKTIIVKGAPVIEIYRRRLTRGLKDEDSIHQSPWSQERLPADVVERSPDPESP